MIEELVRRCMSLMDILCDYVEMGEEPMEDKDYICAKAKEARKILAELVEK